MLFPIPSDLDMWTNRKVPNSPSEILHRYNVLVEFASYFSLYYLILFPYFMNPFLHSQHRHRMDIYS